MIGAMMQAGGAMVSGFMDAFASKKKYKGMAAKSREQAKWVEAERGQMVSNVFFNTQNTRQKGQSLLGKQATQTAGRGVSIGGETSYATTKDTNKIITRNVESQLRERDWDIKVSQREQTQFENQAAAYEKAATQGMISGIVSGLTGGMVSIGSSVEAGHFASATPDKETTKAIV